MGELADRLDRIRVRVEVPGTDIVAELRDRTEVVVSFTANGYYRATEDELQRHLATLGRLLWAAWTRHYYEELSGAFGETRTGEEPPRNDDDRTFREARDVIVAEGSSADGRVTIAATGLRDWRARIEPGTLRSLSDEDFAAAVRQAAAALIRDQQAKIVALKTDVYSR